MSRNGDMRKAQKFIRKKKGWVLPQKLTEDKEAYLELLGYILDINGSYEREDIKTLTSQMDKEVFKDFDFVNRVDDILAKNYDSRESRRYVFGLVDRDVAFSLIRKNHENLSYMNETIRDDDDIVRFAVSKRGGLLYHASDRLKDDRDIVRVAVTNDPTSISNASMRLKNDIELGRYAVSKSGKAFYYLSEELRGNKEIALIAVEDPEALAIKYVSDRLKNDIDVAVTAVRANGKAIEYCSIENRSEHAVISEAIKHSPELIKHASRRYLYSQPLLFKACLQNSAVLEYVPEEMSRSLVEMLDNYDSANTNSFSDDSEKDY